MNDTISPPTWFSAVRKLRADLITYTIDGLVMEACDVSVEIENTGHAFHEIPTAVYLYCMSEDIEKRINNAYVLGKAVQNDE